MEKDIIVLAIESSCDETAAAVVEDGRKVLSSVISFATFSVTSLSLWLTPSSTIPFL